MINLDLTKNQTDEILSLPPYKKREVRKWLLRGATFDQMTTIDKTTRSFLKDTFFDRQITIEKEYLSKDGTCKFLLKLFDDNLIECVLMDYQHGKTLCISTQIGCKMNCSFCASGANGFVRNLTATELYQQVIFINNHIGEIGKRKITNIVLMGSGEPLDNYDNVIGFFSLLKEEDGLGLSMRNISLSTCGIVPKIKDLANLKLGVNLTISLHTPFQDKREEIMPIAKIHSIKSIMDGARYFFKMTGRRVIFEYTLIDGENVADENIAELKKIIKGFPCHINCILLNQVDGTNFKSITKKEAYQFVEKLNKEGLSATLRRQMGNDIESACGQLKRRFLEECADK